MNKWTTLKDEIGFVHYLPINDDCFMKVEKTRGGDYSITAMRHKDASGGAVEYQNTLASAKRYAENIVKDGKWMEYLPEDD